MTEKLKDIQHTIEFAKKTQSVVKMMKAFSSSKIREFRSSSEALKVYQDAIRLSLTAIRFNDALPSFGPSLSSGKITDSILVGSDHGMVGHFNDSLVQAMRQRFSPQKDSAFIVIGNMAANQVYHRNLKKVFPTPLSVDRIPQLIGELLDLIIQMQEKKPNLRLAVFYNEPSEEHLYQATHHLLFPLSLAVVDPYIRPSWPTNQIPELLGKNTMNYVRAVIQEFLYVSLFRMCTDSLLAEHATRLASMQEAEKNIEELLDVKKHQFNQARQELIDRELFELISGFQAVLNRQ